MLYSRVGAQTCKKKKELKEARKFVECMHFWSALHTDCFLLCEIDHVSGSSIYCLNQKSYLDGKKYQVSRYSEDSQGHIPCWMQISGRSDNACSFYFYNTITTLAFTMFATPRSHRNNVARLHFEYFSQVCYSRVFVKLKLYE